MKLAAPYGRIIIDSTELIQSIPISLDIFEDPVTTFCQHTYCRKCLEGHIKCNGTKQACCPLCKMPVGKRNYIADKKATILAQIILNIKPVKKLVINETPKRDLLSTRKRKSSEISSFPKGTTKKTYLYTLIK